MAHRESDDKFFRPIGEHAAETDELSDERTGDNDAPVEEIESLCLECHKNVGDRKDAVEVYF
jgi:hypothetical protein